ncbi:putative protein-synthesizing GTPase [Medicago truncatula]|uniref:GTP-eEF1A C-terminal domain-containing protein n=1 Tax=Medicago truncatula TaxID=3880 RepID=A0A396GCB3_MEDTR|nr:putative protein-synthesizing GTPase [Medicago truncatula]
MGPTLLEAIDRMKEPKRPSNLPLRLPIMDFYKIGGIGVVSVGRVETGCLCPGMSVTFAPTGLQIEVQSVKMYPGILATKLQAEVNSSQMHREISMWPILVIEERPAFLKNGDDGLIEMVPTKPMVVEPFYLYPPLGHFVVRYLHQTVAVGVVISATTKRLASQH